MTVISAFLTVAACEHCYSAKQPPTVDPEGRAHPNQLLKVNLEQVKVHSIFAGSIYNVVLTYPLYQYSVYISYWIVAKNNLDSRPYLPELGLSCQLEDITSL